ncbi:hypothetical protein [Bacillus wiedmannii]|uniref:hypothetical protein n=1 Tax=Bacillus wiedmannii TaxID=1890302 RepID=UPI001F4F4A24|nr:hypothetical protein [Bacillus wiedmannii]
MHENGSEITVIKSICNDQGMLLKKVASDLNKSVLQAIESGKKGQSLSVHRALQLSTADQLKNYLYPLIIEHE